MARRQAGSGARGRRRPAGALAKVASGQRALQGLAKATADLHEVGAPFALIGGLAIAARAEPRLTKDVDFAVAVPGEGEAERVVHALAGLGYTVESVLEHAPTGRLATVRLHDAKGVLIDLLFASSGVERRCAEKTLRLITERGFARHRDLLILWRKALTSLTPPRGALRRRPLPR